MIRIIFYFSLFIFTLKISAQNQDFDIVWGNSSKTNYSVVLGKEINNKNILDLFNSRGYKDSLVQAKIFDLVDSQLKKKRLKCSIKPSGENFVNKLTIFGLKAHKGIFNNKGYSMTQVKSSHKNIYNFFYSLPINKVSIGDSWELNIKLPGDFKNIKLNYSDITNEVTFLDLVVEGDKQIAIFKTLYETEINYEFKKDKSKKGKSSLFYVSLTEYDIKSQKIHRIRGFLTSHDIDLDNTSIQLLGMKVKE